jgi:hypothetical protein
MRIGILTLHNQNNYGGVLQAYALQESIKELGYSVVILNKELPGFLPEQKNITTWKKGLRWYLYKIFGLKPELIFERTKNTKKFINEKLILSKERFNTWDDLKNKSLNVDCIIVGSDQVWHLIDIEKLKIFLLIDAPKIPAISYAASIGMTNIPNNKKDLYIRGLKNFKAISMRESEGVEIISQLGFNAVHVADPTLLLSTQKWYDLTNWHPNKDKRLFCYFMIDTWLEVFPILQQYVQKYNCIIDVFFNNGLNQAGFLTQSKSFYSMFKWVISKINKDSRIILHLDAGPNEFLHYVSLATDAISDSFHALMFSIIFKINIKIVRPNSQYRQEMFSRIQEFEKYTISGNLISNNLNDALNSIYSEEPVKFDENIISQFRQYSQTWLINQLEIINNNIIKN